MSRSNIAIFYQIGMMRTGRLLTEDSPQNLLAVHNMTSLEDVFLKLCMKNDVSNDGNSPTAVPSTSTTLSSDNRRSHPSLAPSSQRQNKTASSKRQSRFFDPSMPSPHRIMTLTHKNFVQTFRNIGLEYKGFFPNFYIINFAMCYYVVLFIIRRLLLFNFVFPTLIVSFLCIAIGHDPTSLQIAIVNDELAQGSVCNYSDTCSYSMLGCRYLRFLSNETISQV